MKTKENLDEIDRKILTILQANARITNTQLATEVGLSPAPTLERVRKLESSGFIKSYHAVLDPELVGLGVSTLVMVSLRDHNASLACVDAFREQIEKIDEVIECHHVTGSGDFILKIITEDITSYQKLMMERVANIDVVDNMQSFVILSTFKDSKIIPIPESYGK